MLRQCHEMPTPQQLTLYRRAFVDVCNGYSVGRTKAGDTVYVRHLSHVHHQFYDALQAQFEAEAVAQGAQSEAQRLDQLYAKGEWSPARETEIATKRDFISRLEDGRRLLPLPSQQKGHEEHIAREKETLLKTLNERARLVGETTETYAARRLDDYYLAHNLFRNSELTAPYYAPETFDALSDDEVDAIREIYREAVEPCSDVNLRKLAAQDLFMSYYTLAPDDARAFFGRAVCELTYYQVCLLGSARYVKALIDNTDMTKLSPEQRNDPEALERAHTSQKNMAKIQADGAVAVGMTPEDVKATGQQFHAPPPPGLSGVELVKWMQRQNALAPR